MVFNFLRGFAIWFKVLLEELVMNIISVLLIFILYFMLWHFPQTLDLLLVLNQNDATNYFQLFTLEVPLYFTLLLTISLFIWNAPKYYYKENYNLVKFKNVIGFVPTKHYKNIKFSNKYSYNCKYHIRKILPRVLGCLVMFISAFAILNAMEAFGIKNDIEKYLNPNNTLVIIIICLLLLLEYHIYNFIKRIFIRIPKRRVIIVGSVFFLISIMLILALANTQSEEDLVLLFTSNLALAFIFFIIAFNTRNLFSIQIKPFFYGSIISSGLIILMLYILFNINPSWARLFNPLSVLLICLTALYTLSFFLVFGGKKLRFPLFSITLIVILCLGEYNEKKVSYKHYTLEENTINSHQRVNLKRYVYNWIANRKSKIEQAEKGSYPVLFISSEGGGSRAGLWAFLVHSYLSKASNGAYFNDYLFSLTGASGGNVGNAMFFATAQQAKEKDKQINYISDSEFKYKASDIYSKNYLSTSLLGIMGRDLLSNIIGFSFFDNRGELLQREWQEAYNKVFKARSNYLEKDVLSFYKKADTLDFVPPLLLLNASHAQTGQYSVVSPVNFNNIKAFSGYYDFIKELRIEKGQNKSIRMDEAMRMNAAFPYLTPAGEVKGMGLFGDAGYYDNIGGTVTANLMRLFKEVLNTSVEFVDIKDKVNVKSILIFSDLDNEPKNETISQIKAPLKMLLKVREGHTKEQINTLDQVVKLPLKTTKIAQSKKTSSIIQEKIKIMMSTKNDSITPVLPLGRYLSGTAVMAIEKRLESSEIKLKLDKLLVYKKIKR